MSATGHQFKDKDCLLVIDVQNDFCPGGNLPIDEGERVVPVLNRRIKEAAGKNVPVFLSRDWHPAGHISFKAGGGQWPEHCIQDTDGAMFHPDLNVPDNAIVVTKGVRFDKDQNSAFDETGLAHKLRRDNIERLIVGGLALDVCVLATVMDALKEGFGVIVLLSATRPVTSDGGSEAVEKMKSAGAVIVD